MSNKTESKPFLKWAGGKAKLVPLLAPHLGDDGRLVEPFVGSGAVFMGTDFDEYLLCDTNPDLIYLYKNLKNNTTDLISQVEDLFQQKHNSDGAYYALRDEFNELDSSDIRKSALFVYLNKHGFNGLCRYNSKGGFNVPFGRYASPTAPINAMRAFAAKSERAEFVCCDFSRTFDLLKPNDIVYCDPPYVPLSSTSSFTAYAKGAFNEVNQTELAQLCELAAKRGVKVIVSNHNTEFTQTLYTKAELHSVEVRRSISSKASTRGKVSELIAVFEGEMI